MLIKESRMLELNNIYCMDCLEGMKLLEDNSVDLVLTDPPYGIDIGKMSMGKGGGVAKKIDYGVINWDTTPPSKEYFDEMFRVSKNQVIFGGNYFELPPSPCWVVWDKDNGDTDFSDCELVWTSFNKAVRKVVFKWAGMLQGDMRRKEVRFHPTQKPVYVIKWLLERFSNEGGLVLDPFIGSGTTALACKQLNRNFIGFEIEPKYCDIANKRLVQRQLREYE